MERQRMVLFRELKFPFKDYVIMSTYEVEESIYKNTLFLAMI